MGSNGRYNPEGGDQWVGSNVKQWPQLPGWGSMGGKQWEAMAATIPRVGINGWEAMGSNGRYNPEGGDQWVGSNGKQWEAMATTPRVGINGWEGKGGGRGQKKGEEEGRRQKTKEEE